MLYFYFLMYFMLEEIQIFTSVVRDIMINISICAIILYFAHCLFRNWQLNKYKATNKNFEVRCCLEDGSEKERDKIYLIDKNRKTCQWIENAKTFNKIFMPQGFKAPSRKDEDCFSKVEYKERRSIKFDENLSIDIINLLSILK